MYEYKNEVKGETAIFKKALNLPKQIVDYLFDNAPNLWKLLYYVDVDDFPLDKKDLTNKQKSSMICSSPKDMYDTNVSTTKNILFQLQIDEAFSNSVPQIRICTGAKHKLNPYQGYMEIYFQIVIPNKQLLFRNNDNNVCDRSDAIVCELMEALDGFILPNSQINSALFVDKSAKDGVGRNTGVERDVQNKNFSGQYLTFACLI